MRHDFKSFCTDLLDERSLFHYPTFLSLVYVYLKHTKNEVVETAALEMGSRLRQYFSDRILGPDKPANSTREDHAYPKDCHQNLSMVST